jgi:hypothetical protein
MVAFQMRRNWREGIGERLGARRARACLKKVRSVLWVSSGNGAVSCGCGKVSKFVVYGELMSRGQELDKRGNVPALLSPMMQDTKDVISEVIAAQGCSCAHLSIFYICLHVIVCGWPRTWDAVGLFSLA